MFLSLGAPQEIKTDSSPTYTGKVLDKFLKEWGVRHTFGIPCSPTGHAIIERTHHALKSLLDKQKRGEPEAMPHMRLNKALYVLNFLKSCFSEPNPPILRHFSNSTQAKLRENPFVLIRNPETGPIEGPLQTNHVGQGFSLYFHGARSEVGVGETCEALSDLDARRYGSQKRIPETERQARRQKERTRPWTSPRTTHKESKDLGFLSGPWLSWLGKTSHME